MRNALCSLVLLATCAPAQTAEGTVVDSVTGNGIGAAFVSLMPASDRRRVWTRTFYPGVARFDAISRIEPQPGSELSGVEIKLLAVPSHAVRGVLLNPDGTPASMVTITLGEQRDASNGHTMFPRDPARTLRTETNADGAFEFAQVADGEWRLAAQVGSAARSAAPRSGSTWRVTDSRT